VDSTLKSVATPRIDANSLAYALARNACGEKLALKDALAALGVELDAPVERLMRSDGFKRKYSDYVRELVDSGESFKLKARVQAEELLATQWEIIHDRNAPHSVRMEGIKNVVEWADLKPKKTDSGASQPPAITINIDLGGEKREVIDVTPQPEALEAK
jgi:hypothetical protein